MKNLASKKENISCLHSQNCQVAIYGAICLFSFFALFLLSNVCTHAVPNASVSASMPPCLCFVRGCLAFVAVWVSVCMCVCVRVCGRASLLHILQLCALKTCLLDISRRSHWARSTCRTTQDAESEDGQGNGGAGSSGVQEVTHIEQKNAIIHGTQQGKQSGQTGISSREERTITSLK